MAIATATTAALIGAAGGLGGAALHSRASGRAGDVQDRATRDALAFEREREASRRAEYDRAMADRRRQYDAWNRMRLGLMQRYGGGRLTLGSMGGQPDARASSASPRRRMTLGDYGLEPIPTAPTRGPLTRSDLAPIGRAPAGRELMDLAEYLTYDERNR